MDQECTSRKKAAVAAAATLVICVVVSLVCSAVSVGVVENLPVFSKSTINYGVQGSQLFQTVRSQELNSNTLPRSSYNSTDCDLVSSHEIARSLKSISLCRRGGQTLILLVDSSPTPDDTTIPAMAFTYSEWKRFLKSALDVITSSRC